MMRILHYCTFLLIIFPIMPVIAQDQSPKNMKNLFVEAESFFLFEEYKEALPLYQQIIRVEKDNYQVIYKIGICYLNDEYLKQKSVKYLEQASQHTNSGVKAGNFKEKQAPLESLFFLGKAYRINNQLDEAIAAYQRFINFADPEVFDTKLVDDEIASCQLAKKMFNNPGFFKQKNLGPEINTRFSEINAVISGDGKSLAFTRQMQFYDGIFLSKRDDHNNWSVPVNLTPDMGLDGNSYTTGISYSGDEIFAYRSDHFDGNIYSSKLNGKKWSKFEKLNDNINTRFWESHASPSADGKYLYFTSNRDGGYGGLDIYRSTKGNSGQWGPAINLGPVINSPYNEETPFMSNEGYTLFFSSQGHKTIGGYDVFVSNLQSNGTWGIPKNMGYPFNTTDDDLFYCPTGVNSFGLYSVYNASTSEGLSDIYFIEVYNELIPRTFTINGKLNIENLDPNYYKKIDIKLIDKKSNTVVSQIDVGKDGNYSLNAKQGEYLLVIEGSDILTVTRDISLRVYQSDALISLPVITLEKSLTETPPLAIEQPVKSNIIIKNDFFAVSDSTPIVIDLILPRGADLLVETNLGSALINTEKFSDVKKRFSYFYSPKQGENRLKFTATEDDGNVSTAIVVVNYYPPLSQQEIGSGEPNTERISTATDVFGIIAVDKLSEFLKTLNDASFDNNYQLYSYLVDQSLTNGFSKHEVDSMFSIYYTQKDLRYFDSELRNNLSATNEKWDLIRDSSSIPLQYLNRLLLNDENLKDSLTIALLRIVNESDNPEKLIDILNDFSSVKMVYGPNDLLGLTPLNTFALFEKNTDPKLAKRVLHLSSTTGQLESFHQNLQVTSEENLNKYVSKLDLQASGITNAIQLAQHLFNKADTEGYTTEELIKALDLIETNRSYYMRRFIDLLKSEASGTLKSQLLLLDLKENNLYTYNDLLEYLLDQSKFKNFSRESVYDLYLKLIGIDNVNEFADLVRSYNYKAINKALDDTTLTYFSNPLELLQYLLASANYYGYSESDINNLLIRMILERGLERDLDKYKSREQKFWKSPKFITSIILVNIIILVLILLIAMRRKNNK